MCHWRYNQGKHQWSEQHASVSPHLYNTIYVLPHHFCDSLQAIELMVQHFMLQENGNQKLNHVNVTLSVISQFKTIKFV